MVSKKGVSPGYCRKWLPFQTVGHRVSTPHSQAFGNPISRVITVTLLNRTAILTFIPSVFRLLSKLPTQPLTLLRPLLGSRFVSMEFTEGI